MYDTLHMWLEWSKVKHLDLNKTRSVLSNIKEYGSADKNSQYGKLKNFIVTIHDTGISLKGSLAIYYYGNNFETLTRDDTKKALERLSSELGLPIDLSKINRLDVATNFIMERPVSNYFPFLGDKPYFKRVQATETSLYYITYKKRLNIYDKTKQAKDKRLSIPDKFKGKNVLRYEMRLEKRVSKQFNTTELIASTLYDKEFYDHLMLLYTSEYTSIHKINKLNIENLDNIKTPKQAVDAICGAVLNKAGLDMIPIFINDLKSKEIYQDPKCYSRVKSKLKKLANNVKISEQNELLTELDTKIMNQLY